MFTRYLGGGIGHLEQFRPASNDDAVTYEYEDNGNDGGTRNTDIDGGNRDDDEDDGEDEGEDEDDEAAEGDEHSDPGESSDEDAGNTY